MARRRMTYREPAVTQGPDQPIPETRPEVLARIKERLEREGAFRQEYSNGEFISSSLAVGKTFEACKAVRTLDGAGYTVHWDEKNQLFWRRTGCFD